MPTAKWPFRLTVPVLASILIAGMCAVTASAAAVAAAEPYSVVRSWPQLPGGTSLGHVAGVAVDSRGDVLVFNRAENSFPTVAYEKLAPVRSPAVIGFDGATGRIVSAWGAGRFKMPHGLRVDAGDNVWLTDIVLQQVFKFSRDGKLLLTLGTADVVGCDASHFNGPTDVAVLPDGSVFVADGYGSSRIAKFAADGRFLFSWGRCSTTPRENLLVFQRMGRGKEPGAAAAVGPIRGPYDGPAEFNTPHSIVYDPVTRLLYVADRDNSRIQVYNADGKFVRTLKSSELGRPWAIALGPDHSLYVVDGGDLTDGPGGGLAAPYREAILKIDGMGRIVAKWSGFGNRDGQIYWGHDIAVDRHGAVYVGDVSHGMRVQKFIAQAAGSRQGRSRASRSRLGR